MKLWMEGQSLHPKIHSGILQKERLRHQSELKKINANYIDLVVVNLYPLKNFKKKFFRE